MQFHSKRVQGAFLFVRRSYLIVAMTVIAFLCNYRIIMLLRFSFTRARTTLSNGYYFYWPRRSAKRSARKRSARSLDFGRVCGSPRRINFCRFYLRRKLILVAKQHYACVPRSLPSDGTVRSRREELTSDAIDGVSSAAAAVFQVTAKPVAADFQRRPLRTQRYVIAEDVQHYSKPLFVVGLPSTSSLYRRTIVFTADIVDVDVGNYGDESIRTDATGIRYI